MAQHTDTYPSSVFGTGANKGDTVVCTLGKYSGLTFRIDEAITKGMGGKDSKYSGRIEVIDSGDGKYSIFFIKFIGKGLIDIDKIYSDVLANVKESSLKFHESRNIKVKDRSLTTAEESIVDDILRIVKDKSIDSTVKETLILARRGQDQFRRDVLEKYGKKCCVTGSTTLEAIRASHIKPWKISTDKERLDPCNGLPLLATLDALFDQGLITFSNFGKMIISPLVIEVERDLLGLSGLSIAPEKLDTKTKTYLEWHRGKFRGTV